MCNFVDPCESSSPCQNNGTCSNPYSSNYTCSCDNGYSGTDCEYEGNLIKAFR